MLNAIEILRKHKAAFGEVSYTQPAANPREAAASLGIELSHLVKTMPVRIGQDTALLLLPGDVRPDMKALATALGLSTQIIQFQPEEVEALFKCPAPAVSPLHALDLDLACMVDGRVMDAPEIYIASGDPMLALRIAPEDLMPLLPRTRVLDLLAAKKGSSAGAGTIEPRILRGFRDYLHAEMSDRQEMIRKISRVFELYGFAPLQTPALEYSDILVGKYGADAEKLLYRFKDNGGRDICLRYDLTVPLARLAAQYQDLTRPFKRYQVAPVWRAEKPGRGRFREFYQCDADIIGASSMIADAECVALGHDILRALGVKDFRIMLNNRKVLNALAEVLKVESDSRMLLVFRTIDKLPSQGEARVRELLQTECGCADREVGLIFEFLGIKGSSAERIEAVGRIIGASKHAELALTELRAVLGYARELGVEDGAVEVDFSIARGLDYYTGTVYETFLTRLPGFGSVMSGGRYDGLISRFLGSNVPAVGISVGLDRLYEGLREMKIAGGAGAHAEVFVAVLDRTCLGYGLGFARQARAAGLRCETVLEEAQNLKKQMKTANAKGIRYVVLVGTDEVLEGKVALKDMTSGGQEKMSVTDAIGMIKGER